MVRIPFPPPGSQPFGGAYPANVFACLAPPVGGKAPGVFERRHAGSLIASSREEWEKTFNVCWGGVYHSTRAFLPMLQRAGEGHIVNTSSINGFWASIGPRVPHTAYSAAKFAVK